MKPKARRSRKCRLALAAIAAVLAGLPIARAEGPPPTPKPSPTAAEFFTPATKPEMLDIIPTFFVADMTTAEKFYTEMLGFFIVLKSGAYTAVGKDYVQIGLVQDKVTARNSDVSCYVKVAGVDEYYKSIEARGGTFLTKLATQPSKMREFSLKDSDGNVLIFGEYVGPR